VAAWLGMVPRHEGTGGQATLGRISKRGDVYLRTLLIHGARAVIAQIERKPDQADGWLRRLLTRRNKNIAAVALTAKNARIAWALLAHERNYPSDYVAKRAAA
jgi:transposase